MSDGITDSIERCDVCKRQNCNCHIVINGNGENLFDEYLKLKNLVSEIEKLGLGNLIQFRMESILKEISPPNTPTKSQAEFKMMEYEKLKNGFQILQKYKESEK